MQVTLTEPQIEGLALLDGLTADQRSTLSKEAAAWKPTLDLESFAKRLSERLALDSSELENAFNTIAAIPGHARRSMQPLKQAMADVLGAYATREDEMAEPKPELVQTVQGLLKPGSAFSVASKALNLTWEHSELYNDVRIVADLRPLFEADIGSDAQKLVGHVLTHTLRLSYLSREREMHEARFILMTHKDLLELQKAVERALAKHATIISQEKIGELIQ